MLLRRFIIIGTARNPSKNTKCWVPKGKPPYGLLFRPTIEMDVSSGASNDKELQKQANAVKQYFEINGWEDVKVSFHKIKKK